jgi:hypothetical protein
MVRTKKVLEARALRCFGRDPLYDASLRGVSLAHSEWNELGRIVPSSADVPVVILCYEGVVFAGTNDASDVRVSLGDVHGLHLEPMPDKFYPTLTIKTSHVSVSIGPIHTKVLNLYSLHRFLAYELPRVRQKVEEQG